MLANTITARSHYSEGHPAISQADDNAFAGFTRVLNRIPELVVAIIDGEFVVCERPLPELRSRLHVLAESMLRHQVQCIVFQRGMTRAEAGVLGTTLAMSSDVPGRVREHAQAYLTNVLLRFAGITVDDALVGAGAQWGSFIPYVREALLNAARALANDAPLDKLGILAIANQIVHYCTARAVDIQQRSWTRSIDDLAAHATNVAMMTAAMAIESGYQQRTCVDVTAAALLHDIGHLLLPEEIRGIPEPLLDPSRVPIFRNHTFAGASMLLGAGCSPLWVVAAFEHHRGVDGEGYPALERKEAPHELVRIIALANYYDRKRTRLHGRGAEPEEVLQMALALEERYFGRPLLRRFLRVLGVFPPGTTVELSNRQPAIVTKANPADPWRPQVQLLRGPQVGRHAELREMDLKDGRHHLSIVRAISPPLLLPQEAAIRSVAVEPAPKPEVAATTAQPNVPPLDDPDDDSLVLGRGGARAPLPNAPPAPQGPTAVDRARQELGMDALLDDLLSVPADALVTAMPPAPSAPPPAPARQTQRPPQAVVVPPSPKVPFVPPAEPMAQPKPARSPRVPTPMAPFSPQPLPPPRRASAPAMKAPTVPPVAAIAATEDAREIERKYVARIGALDRVPSLVPEKLASVALDHKTGFVLTRVDGTSTIAQIVDSSGLPRVEVLKVLDDLFARGALKIS